MERSDAAPVDTSSADDSASPRVAENESGPAPSAHEMAPVGKRFIVLYTLATLSATIAINTPIFVTLALRVADVDPDGKTTSYALLSGLGMLAATISAPAFGALSDRTRSRFGMRRPWIVLGLIGTAAGGCLMGIAHDLISLTAGWLVMSAFATVVASLLVASIADWVPVHQQNFMGGLVGACNLIAVLIGSVIVALVPHHSFLQLNIPVVLAIVAVLAFVLSFPDRRLDGRAHGEGKAPTSTRSLRDLVSGMYLNPRESPDFACLLASLFLVSIGGALGTTYGVYFLEDHMKVGSDDLTTVVAYSNAATCLPALIGAPLAGWLADKTDRRRPILLFGVLSSALGLVIIAFGPDLLWFYLGSFVTGVGTAAYSGVYIGYAIATMGETEHSARNLGLTNVAISLPLTLAPFITPLFLYLGSGGHNYISLYVGGAVISLLGVPLMYRIRNAR